MWQEAMERGGLKVNAANTEVMVSRRNGSGQVEITDRHGVGYQQKFKYLGLLLMRMELWERSERASKSRME